MPSVQERNSVWRYIIDDEGKTARVGRQVIGLINILYKLKIKSKVKNWRYY